MIARMDAHCRRRRRVVRRWRRSHARSCRGIPLAVCRAGFPRARRAGRQSDERGEGRARREVVCRPAPVDHRPAFLRRAAIRPARAFTDGLRAFARRDRAKRCRSMRRRCSMWPTTRRSAGAMPELRTLEQQMRGPLFNEHPRELGLAGREAHRRTRAAADARDGRRALPPHFRARRDPVTMDNVIRAIAAYERTLFAGNSAVRPLRVRAAITRRSSERQKRGMAAVLFRRAAAARRCHGGINFAGEWVDRDHPQARARLRRHRHGRGGARADAAQSAGDRALPARWPLRDARRRCSITTSSWPSTRPRTRACGARH